MVEVVFDKMKLAGEAGTLLKIEEEIRDAVVLLQEAVRPRAGGGTRTCRPAPCSLTCSRRRRRS